MKKFTLSDDFASFYQEEGYVVVSDAFNAPELAAIQADIFDLFESRFRESNREIHTTKDTLEMSGNNAKHAAKFARLGAAFALELAKGTLEPAKTSVVSPVSTPTTPDRAPSRWPLIASLFGLLGLAGVTRRVAR